MKNIIWAIIVLVIAAGFLMQGRYTLYVHSPIVAKLDNFTGNVWIVNSGEWIKVQNSTPVDGQQVKAVIPQRQPVKK